MPIVHCMRWREADADAKFARRIFGDGDECRRTRQRYLAHFIPSRPRQREISSPDGARAATTSNTVIGRGCTGVVDRSGSCPARDRHEVIRDRARYRAPRATIPRRRGALKRFKVRQAGQRMHDERSVFRSGVRKSGPIPCRGQFFIMGSVPAATRDRRTKGRLRSPPSTEPRRSRKSENDGSVVGRSKPASFDNRAGEQRMRYREAERLHDLEVDRHVYADC
jgi:hypothetical protein